MLMLPDASVAKHILQQKNVYYNSLNQNKFKWQLVHTFDTYPLQRKPGDSLPYAKQ
jgi:hypothetical protein